MTVGELLRSLELLNRERPIYAQASRDANNSITYAPLTLHWIKSETQDAVVICPIVVESQQEETTQETKTETASKPKRRNKKPDGFEIVETE